ncbi:MAG: hypothetical protein OEW30_17270, partial [Acidimicrobiia bacterium]|nr:hypothetical protein [Acidimicrobiia bacterium]
MSTCGGHAAGSAVGDGETGYLAGVEAEDRGGVLEAVLPPSGFGVTFHLVDGTGVFAPKWVEVRCPDSTEWIVTYDKPGVGNGATRTVECYYRDPAGLDVHLIGI